MKDDPIDARLWPYVAPYGVLLSLAELGRWLPALEVPLLVARVALPAALLLIARRSGAYAELSRAIGASRCAMSCSASASLPCGWLRICSGPSSRVVNLFDPDRLGPERRTAWLALRLCGFVLVSPLVEELFVRSFLHRAAEAWPSWATSRRVRSAALTRWPSPSPARGSCSATYRGNGGSRLPPEPC